METDITRLQLIQLLVVVIIGAGVGQLLQQTAPIGRNVGENMAAQSVLEDRSSPSREVDKPTLTLVVFTDYQCTACKAAYPAMDAMVKKDGHVRIVYKDWPIFGRVSEQAARIAIAADRQGIYSEVHARLLNERRRLDGQVLREAIEVSQGSWAQVQRDLRTYAADIDSQLDRNRQDAFKLGLEGTPAYLAGTILVTGGLSEPDFAKVFARGRKRASNH